MSVGLYLLDTNMVSYFISGRSPAVRKAYWEAEVSSRFVISTITEGEILFGVEKKPEATRMNALLEEFITKIEILPWDSAAAAAYGSLRAQLSRSGKALSLMDLLIASHAIATGATLVTHDHAFLHASPFLNVVDWATDL